MRLCHDAEGQQVYLQRPLRSRSCYLHQQQSHRRDHGRMDRLESPLPNSHGKSLADDRRVLNGLPSSTAITCVTGHPCGLRLPQYSLQSPDMMERGRRLRSDNGGFSRRPDRTPDHHDRRDLLKAHRREKPLLAWLLAERFHVASKAGFDRWIPDNKKSARSLI